MITVRNQAKTVTAELALETIPDGSLSSPMTRSCKAGHTLIPSLQYFMALPRVKTWRFIYR